jgi:hypothetical protein
MRFTIPSTILTLACLAVSAKADFLETYSMITANGGGQTGVGAETNCMIISDGTTWSGGAAGLQGSNSKNPYLTSPPLAANILFKFNTGAMISHLDSTYGAGNWAISGARLKWTATYYANNTRFGGGAGDFDIYWVGNDNWNATTGDATPAPIYTTDPVVLQSWSPNLSLVDDNAYYEWHDLNYFTPSPSWVTYKTTDPWVPRLTYDLTLTDAFLQDADAGGNVSFYLMAHSDTLGMCIFTGGYSGGTGSNEQPTLVFDISSVPEPASLGLLGLGCACVLLRRRK